MLHKIIAQFSGSLPANLYFTANSECKIQHDIFELMQVGVAIKVKFKYRDKFFEKIKL